MFKEIFYERARTRDLLLEYDKHIMPPHPHSAGLAIIYPWENISINMIAQEIYALARSSGYNDSFLEFQSHFGAFLGEKPIISATYSNFPETGELNKLYFDTIEKILYCWNNSTYVPVNALLITDTILDSGGAPEEEG